MNERFARAPVGMLEVTPDGTVTAINDAATELLDVDAIAAEDAPIDVVFPDSVDNAVPGAFDGTAPSESSLEEYYPGLDKWLSVSLVPTDRTVTVYLRDRSSYRECEQHNDQLRAELDRLAVLNELISAVLEDLLTASTREEIAETVCERLGETDIYEFAWFGERKVGSDEILVRASAGTTGRTFEQIQHGLEEAAALPEQRAIETGTPQVSQPIADDRSIPESVRRAVFADGIQSLLAIPLKYGSSVYGVVGVYATDRNAFSEREKSSFATVGSIAGFAVNATRNRTLLRSDAIVKLTVQVSDTAEPLVAVATEIDAELTVEGVIQQDTEQLLGYLIIEDTTPERLANAVSDVDAIDLSRIVEENDASGTVEIELDVTTALGTLSAQGTGIRSATFEPGRGRIEVELPPDEETRRIADTVTRRFDAEVLAKRKEKREIETAQGFRDRLQDRLTERQETALRTAYLADYFESPRSSTAEEVATALDITAPTLLHHLRASQRKLLEEFFQTTESSSQK
jgi:predicted DNA binding protein